MTLIVKDSVRDTTTTAGTGAITVSGTPPTGYAAFSSIPDGYQTFIAIHNQTLGEWETSIATVSGSGLILTRNTILESSNGGAAVSFTGSTKDVFCCQPAKKAVDLTLSRGLLETLRLGAFTP